MHNDQFYSESITIKEWRAHKQYHTRRGIMIGLLVALPFIVALFVGFQLEHRLFNDEVRATDYYYHLSVQQANFINYLQKQNANITL